MNKQKKIKKNLSQKSFGLRTRLFLFSSLFLLIIFIGFSYLFFNAIIKIGKNTQSISSESLRNQAEVYLRQITDDVAQKNNEIFRAVTRQAFDMSVYMSNVYSNPDIFRPGEYWQAKEQMVFGENQQYLNSATDTASVFVPNFVKVDDALNVHLESMAYFDFVVKDIFSSNEIIKAVHMSSERDAIRYYPNIHLGAVVPPDFKITERDWYKKMNSENNPERKAVLSDIYLDATGNGLMVTAVAPVYANDEFLGGIGIDITIKDIRNNIEQEELPGNGFLFLVNEEANSVILPNRVYASIVKQAPEESEWKIDKDDLYPGFSEVLEEISLSDNNFISKTINNEKYLIAFSRMEDAGWTIGSIVKTVDVLSAIKTMQAEVDQSINNYLFYYILPIGFVIFVVIFIFIFIFARHITNPLLRMNEIVHRIAKGTWQGEKIIIKSKDEIGELAGGFNQMAEDLLKSKKEIEKYNQNLEKEVKDKTAELNTALSSMAEDKQEMNQQRLATLNILEDISESKIKLETMNEALGKRSKELVALKEFSDKLVAAIDMKEIIKITANYFSIFLNFSVVNFLVYNPGDKSDLNYTSFSKEEVSENFVEKTKSDLIKFMRDYKDDELRAVSKITQMIKPRHMGKDLNNESEDTPEIIRYFPLLIKNKCFGIIQIVLKEKNKLKQEEIGLINAIILAFTFSIDRLQSLIMFQQMKTKALVESLSDGILMFGTNREIELVNPAFQKNIGEKEKLLSLFGVYKLLPNIMLHEKVNLALLEGKSSQINEVVFRDKFYEIFVTPVKDIKKNIIGGAIIFHDITYLKEMDQLKTEFVSVASHQLRTPLTAIKLFTDMVYRGEVGELNKEQKDYMGNVKESTDRMVMLVNDLLNVTRIESGKLRVEAVPTDVIVFIKNIIAEAKPLAVERNQKIIFSPEKRNWHKIPFDQGLLRQVIHNLITNALRYSPDNIGEVNVVLKKENDDFFLISVKDNGIGIPKEAQKNIFEKFFRADNAIKAVTEGTGLGLYVSKMITHSAGGKIWFKTKKSRGTTFFVRLPFKGVKSKEGSRGLAIS